ncbi:bifunctional adenosylcobinamide kinase/adenosylcobinamide-phosphate guanylyltransferase [Alkaliphilus sp. MSJ-5]|uniref:Bifunctional adenosylcobinamide kinase/adenosylcobinamide-phosphate guanylyltransferase n=1 Tax=Alkaliphilus flagellatus TaxID=2841507 RepID=A0ABS6G6H2_9FIRM|nr:bifunctional adenosylcobinamide kinase/adenosylcobinamide-phosphate guanylyltransferase [Alkaliphilus flagellatus]MBU5678080.1 bifunctional adenosylcobinamide kinase/adenosylcobinamide-phosphate guanylyltransferase [Alkaliphilus flagellatus]
MKPLILITGGARSGKSTLAEKKALELGENVVYIATAIAFDEGMKDRIKKHRLDRPKNWATVERYKDFSAIVEDESFKASDLILLDCMTLMVTNLMLESNLDFDNCSMEEVDRLEKDIFKEVDELLNIIMDNNKTAIIVTNEVGMGLVPSYRMGNIFRDIAGRVNQYIANKSKEVYFTVSGIEIKIK